jgi:hypothetical protein
MKTKSARPTQWARRLKRELIFWRVLGLGAVAALCVGFAQNKTPQEIRLVSPDGRQSVVLNGFGISFMDKEKTLGRFDFDAVGDSDDLQLNLEVSGGLTGRSLMAHSGEDRLVMTSDRLGFFYKKAVRAGLDPTGLFLKDKSGRSQITLTTPDQGTGGLDFVEHGNLILALGALAHFRSENPPLRNEGALHIADFGKDPKVRLITAAESELHTTR